MGGERLVVYIRLSLFPTDFFCVGNGPGRGKLLCILAWQYCSGQSQSRLAPTCCGMGVQGQLLASRPPSQEGKETTADGNYTSDSSATSHSRLLLSHNRDDSWSGLASWPYRRTGGVSGLRVLFGWKTDEQTKTLSPAVAWHCSATKS